MVIRDIVAIKSVGTYLKKESDELKDLKTNLIKQIKEVEDKFKGTDSLYIINSLEKIISDLNLYTENLNYYGDFMISLANHDSEIISKTKKNLLNTGEIK